MKIVNIIQRYPPALGGSETWCREACRFLAKRGHLVKVLTMDTNKEEEFWREPLDEDRTLVMGKLMYDNGVFVRRYQRSIPFHIIYHIIYKRLLDWGLNIYFYGPHSAEMYGKIGREIKSADVVFLHTIPYPHNFIAYAWARLFRKKIVIVPHFHPDHPHYERPINYWLMKKCDAVIAVSEYEKQYLAKHGISEGKIFVTGNAIDPGKYVPRELDAYRKKLERAYCLKPTDGILTFIGRKMPDKGIEYLIDAVLSMKETIPIKIFLVGPTLEWFKELYIKLTEEEKKIIIDLGVISHQEKVNLLHLTDLFVLPSKYEAFGIVFLEAWACGVPVLGTTQGAMPSLIGSEGFVCRYGDAEDLKTKIRLAFSDIKMLKVLGERGKEKVLKHYTLNAIGVKIEQALRTVFPRKRILICANAYPPNFIGGAELIAHNQAKEVQERGHEVMIFAGELDIHRRRYSMTRERYDGLPVYRIALHPKDYSSEYINFSHRIVEEHFDKVLDEFNPDVVHFHNIVGLSVGLIAKAKRKNIKTVLTVHDHWGFCFKNTLIKRDTEICQDYSKCAECMPFIQDDYQAGIPIRMRKDFLALQLEDVDHFISPSQYLVKTYNSAGFPREKFHVVWYGINVGRFTNIRRIPSNGVVRFSYLGYLGRHKGLDTLLDALSLISRQDCVRINLVGEGEKRACYQKQVKEKGWDGFVKFWGKVDHTGIEKVYRETDVMILPSIWPENQPVSITEAMAAKIPVIASRLGGIPELVEDGKTGFLFKAGNAKELAQKMMEFIDHPERIDLFGEHGYHKILQNSFHHQVEKILQLYSSELYRNEKSLNNYALIACVGDRVMPKCAEAMEQIAKEGNATYRFIMADWLDDQQLRMAKLLWVVDEDVGLEGIVRGLANHIPLVVPERNGELKDLCNQDNCGLYYRDAEEAVECLQFFLSDEAIRSQCATYMTS